MVLEVGFGKQLMEVPVIHYSFNQKQIIGLVLILLIPILVMLLVEIVQSLKQ